ncbi:M28 family peptidase, partial [Thauera butanivorans]|uniref:M28 family peptidase n=1 Tax=Thauera butanivorans TaxID=86174 RepID=UPI000ABE3576
METSNIFLNAEQLLAHIQALAAIGADPVNGGRTRLALTDDEKAGRDLVVQWMRELQLEVRIDRIGNILGILHGADQGAGLQPLMIGSHIDTVCNAGALDGCYGVLAGLAVVRAYRAAGVTPARAIVVAAFSPTRKGGLRYQPDMMGSLDLIAGGAFAASHARYHRLRRHASWVERKTSRA